MPQTTAKPETLMDAIQYFAQPGVAHDYLVSLRWPDGVRCVHCDSDNVGFIKSRTKYQCRACRKQFSAKVGTIFEDSPIGLDKWLTAVWMIANAKNGVSSHEIKRSLGISQKSAWFMLSRIRLAMQTKSFEKLSGTVEVDETLIGGKARFMSKKRRAKFGKGKARKTGSFGKTVVMGVLERGGHVRTEVVTSTKRSILDPIVRMHVEAGSEVHTDALPSYESLKGEFIHLTVDHAQTYVNGHVHTNGMENYWSLVKRCIKGTYISVEPFHLYRHLDEQAYRFNHRKETDRERFEGVAAAVAGRRLTYAKLTGKE